MARTAFDIRRSFGVLVICLLSALLLAACGTAATGSSAPTAAPAAPPPTEVMADEPTEAAMADEPTEAAMADEPTEAAMADEPTEEAMADEPTGPITLAEGTFVAGSTPGDTAEGTATIVKGEDGTLTLRLQHFTSTPGPDVFVTLSASDNPDRDGVKEQDFLPLAMIQSPSGDQEYVLPDDLDVAQYQSVAIWCRQYDVVFGYATLK